MLKIHAQPLLNNCIRLTIVTCITRTCINVHIQSGITALWFGFSELNKIETFMYQFCLSIYTDALFTECYFYQIKCMY